MTLPNVEILLSTAKINNQCHIQLISTYSYFIVIVKWGHSREQSHGVLYSNSNGGLGDTSNTKLVEYISEQFLITVKSMIDNGVTLNELISPDCLHLFHLAIEMSNIYENWVAKQEV